jgi:hypothetical protein
VWALLLVAGLTAAPRRARAVDDVLTPRAIALGSALRASAIGGLGPVLNPAGMTLNKAYNIDISYGFRVQDAGSSLYLAIVDSVTSRVSAGAYYQFVHSSPRFVYGTDPRNNRISREGNEAGLSLALPIGDRFSFGVTTKYITVTTDTPNPAYDPNVTNSPKRITLDSTTTQADAKGFTIDAGLLVRLGESLNLGVVGYNFIPKRSIEAPIALGTGLSYKVGQSFLLTADVVIDFNKYHTRPTIGPDDALIPGKRRTTVRFGGGAEYIIRKIVPLRFGALWDNGLPGVYVSGGTGYQGKRFGVDVSYRQKVSGGLESFIIGGLRVFLQ